MNARILDMRLLRGLAWVTGGLLVASLLGFETQGTLQDVDPATRVVKMHANGKPALDGKIGLVSISMSNATMEDSLFKRRVLGVAGSDRKEYCKKTRGAVE